MNKVNEEKLNQFMAVYEPAIREAATNFPNEYFFPASHAPIVAGKMKNALINNTFNHDGRAIKITCKKLGIKHTVKAINEYLRATN